MARKATCRVSPVPGVETPSDSPASPHGADVDASWPRASCGPALATMTVPRPGDHSRPAGGPGHGRRRRRVPHRRRPGPRADGGLSSPPRRRRFTWAPYRRGPTPSDDVVTPLAGGPSPRAQHRPPGPRDRLPWALLAAMLDGAATVLCHAPAARSWAAATPSTIPSPSSACRSPVLVDPARHADHTPAAPRRRARAHQGAGTGVLTTALKAGVVPPISTPPWPSGHRSTRPQRRTWPSADHLRGATDVTRLSVSSAT
jgi:hypothetical protein